MDTENRMSPGRRPIFMILQLRAGGTNDPGNLDRQTRELLKEIRAMDIESAQLMKSAEKPKQTKAGEIVTIGTVVVTISPAAIPLLVELLRLWTGKGENRMVRIKAQVDNRSVEVEYTPVTMAPGDLKQMMAKITGAQPPT